MKIYQTILIAFLALSFIGCKASNLADSPTGTFKKFAEALEKKDVETMKQTLSAATLKRIEDSARKQNLSLEDALGKDAANAFKKTPETRNERIEGDTATVEVKNGATADWDKIPFVKEDGKWKIALDKFM